MTTQTPATFTGRFGYDTRLIARHAGEPMRARFRVTYPAAWVAAMTAAP